MRLANEDAGAHINRWIARTASVNGVYGIKVFSHQFDLVENSRWALALPDPHFIHFQREDLLGQAISSARAQQTGQFESDQPTHRSPIYAPRLIRAALTRIAHNQARWTVWFARNRIAPLRLSYEQLGDNPQRTAELIASHLGMIEPVRVHLSAVRVQIQRDEISEIWREKFVRDYGDVAYLDDEFGRVRPMIRRWLSGSRLTSLLRDYRETNFSAERGNRDIESGCEKEPVRETPLRLSEPYSSPDRAGRFDAVG